MSKSTKPHMNLIIMGHVDHGKSTTTGHLLYKAGAIEERVIKSYEEEAKNLGKETLDSSAYRLSQHLRGKTTHYYYSKSLYI